MYHVEKQAILAAVRALHAKGYTSTFIAERFNVSVGTVHTLLNVASMPDDVQAGFCAGTVTGAMVRTLKIASRNGQFEETWRRIRPTR
jgi:orotate phosphoribosyltransferase-like protein